MLKYKDVYSKVLPEAKKQSEKPNILLSLVLRPLGIYATLPFLNTKIQPTTITKLSVAASLIGFGFLAFGRQLVFSIIGWFFFFIWVVLDGVDGNLARYKDQTSAMGEVWDAFGGYVAMVLTYFGAGIAAFYDVNRFSFCEPYWFLIIGGATAVMSIFPRLMMHKKRGTIGSNESTIEFTNKQAFGVKQAIAMNVLSLTGFFQILFLACIILRLLNLWILFYGIVNFMMMLISLHSILKSR